NRLRRLLRRTTSATAATDYRGHHRARRIERLARVAGAGQHVVDERLHRPTLPAAARAAARSCLDSRSNGATAPGGMYPCSIICCSVSPTLNASPTSTVTVSGSAGVTSTGAA